MIAVLDAPSVLGLRPPAPGRLPGSRRLPEALRGQGLVERLGGADAGRVEPPPYHPEIEPATGVRNGAAIALDTDVLDPAIMPAVDSPEPGGLADDELVALLRVFAASELATGMQVTIFDPELDPDGHLAAELADAVVAGLSAPPAP